MQATFEDELKIEWEYKHKAEQDLKNHLLKKKQDGNASETGIGTGIMNYLYDTFASNLQAFVEKATQPKSGAVPIYTRLLKWLYNDVYAEDHTMCIVLLSMITLSASINGVHADNIFTNIAKYIGNEILKEAHTQEFINHTVEKESDAVKQGKILYSIKKGLKNRKSDYYRAYYTEHLMDIYKFDKTEFNSKEVILLGAKLIEILLNSCDLFEIYKPKRMDEIDRLIPTEKFWKIWNTNELYLINKVHANCPMVVPPLPWKNRHKGGYHGELKRFHSFIRTAKFTWKSCKNYYYDKYKKQLDQTNLTRVFEVVNHIQATPWKINKDVMHILEKVIDRGGELADKNKYELERQRQQQLMSGIQNQGNFDVAREYVRRALSGQFVPKSSTLGISQQNLDMAIEEAWTQLEGDGNKDQVTKNRELTYLLACFPESTRANAVKRRTNLDLDTLSSGDLLKKFRDTAGLGNINYAVNLYRANKAQAGTVLGSDVCSKLAGLTALLDIYGNEEQAIDLYVQAHHKLEEDGGRYKTQYEKAFSESASGWDFRIDDYTGKRTQRTYYHNSDDSFIDKIARTQYSYLRATGASNNSAMQGVQETLQNNFFMYRGHLLPNGFFDYLSVSDNTPQGKINNGTWILDKMIEKEQAAHSDWNGDWYVVYDDYYGTINIKCTGHEWSSNKSYTIQEFTDAVNNYSDDHPYSPPAPTFIDTIKAKETVGHHFNKQGRFWLPDYN